MFVSCNNSDLENWKNEQATVVADVFTPIVVAGLDCTGTVAIHEDIENGIKKIDWFTKAKIEENKVSAKGIATPICILLVKQAMPMVFETLGEKALPEDWKCNLSTVAGGVGKLAEIGCTQIPF